MSEVYIRSQSKERLINFSNFYSIEYDGMGGEDANQHTLICLSEGGVEELAEYETKERCLEVLDEIEKLCGSYLYAAGSSGFIRGSEPMPPMAAVIPRIYKMPEK